MKPMVRASLQPIFGYEHDRSDLGRQPLASPALFFGPWDLPSISSMDPWRSFVGRSNRRESKLGCAGKLRLPDHEHHHLTREAV
ncbi:hypothetical protein FHS18_004117 [Paenibacillus phyllosphaerae]|uniref:Uncharacterized protein n=1 Tax=Paenibacillus phyllosphaerae TaxID=274593 RepID=A0A7W5B097_9BACL|nr:hypothetical protein [Paenibacillus phyllosphaerae]MBB3112039.1 hypothetical protein [Paenibacillus phyllosphaerae]